MLVASATTQGGPPDPAGLVNGLRMGLLACVVFAVLALPILLLSRSERSSAASERRRRSDAVLR